MQNFRVQEERREREAIRQRDIHEAEQDRRRHLMTLASPARPAECQFCGHFHRGTMIKREELRKILGVSVLRANYNQMLAQIAERVNQCCEETN